MRLRYDQTAIDLPDGKARVTGTCTITGKTHSIEVDRGELLDWLRSGRFIQDAMPSASADEQEFLISGTSPQGWEELFGEDEDASSDKVPPGSFLRFFDEEAR